MKKALRLFCVTALAVLCAVPTMAQLNGTGYYRIRNAQQTTDYISLANDKFNFYSVIAAGGNLSNVTGAGKPYAFECTARYLQNDIHMVNDDEIIIPATVIYAKKRNDNTNNYDYNLIAQGTSLLTLVTGKYAGTFTVTFSNRYITVNKVSGSGVNSLYTAKVELTGTYILGSYSLGERYFIDNDGTFAISESYSATNAKWYIEPVTHFNVLPEVALNGKYYTTIKVSFPFILSGQVEKAYVIETVADGILNYKEIAVTGQTVPAGTPVILQCASPNAADCQLIPTGVPTYTTPNTSVTTGGAPAATETSSYSGNNLLDGTYYCNTDGQLSYSKYNTNGTVTTASINGNHFTKPTDPQKYVIGFNDSGKLGFIKATGTAMPANKAWLVLTENGLFPSVSTPSITPASDTYAEAQTVTIAAEDGATIYYTTDGSEPSMTSTLYSEPFTVSETTTVKAIAIKEGLYNNSEVVTAEYVIEVPVTVLLGDVNDDGEVTIRDVTQLINYLLSHGDTTPFNAANADTSQDGEITIRDVTSLINILLSDGQEN